MAKVMILFSMLFFLGILLVLLQGNGVKGMMAHYLVKQGYVCEGNYCYQCTINNNPCFCRTDSCVCGSETIDKKMCTVKLLWKEIPKG